MFSADQYRVQAAKYAEFAGQENTPNEVREFKDLERTFTVLADNEQWVADNHDRLAGKLDETVHVLVSAASKATLAAEEEHVLRCLGAALVMQWNTLPPGLERDLFESAGYAHANSPAPNFVPADLFLEPTPVIYLFVVNVHQSNSLDRLLPVVETHPPSDKLP